MDYVSGGDLFELLKTTGQFDEARARLYAAEVCCALEYLHSRKILYRDLKLENVLLDDSGHILLCDFGLAKELRQDAGAGVSAASVLETVFCGTKEYMAPEMLGPKSAYGFEVDWWAFGVFLYAMVTGKYPFYARTLPKLETKILNDAVWFPPHMSAACRSLIEGLLAKDPSQRLGLAGIKAHPFFADLDWERVAAKEYEPLFLPEIDEMVMALQAEAAAAAGSAAASSGGETGPSDEVASWVVNSPSMASLDSDDNALRERRARETARSEAAVQECRKILPDEPFIAGWVIISINKWNFEQTRVLLLTSKAMYRVKYDFNSGSAERGFDHAARTPLSDIMTVQRGRMHDSRFASITDALNKPPTLYAMRLVSLSENLRRTTKARTFCPFMTPTGSVEADLAEQAELTDTILGTILAARENLLGTAEAALIPIEVSLHRETLSAPRVKDVVQVRETAAAATMGRVAASADAPTRLRELATVLAEVNSQIADTTQLLAQLHNQRDSIKAELDVRPDLWFFECHFKGDPVMPGCLGLDALWQLTGFFLGWLGEPGRGRALGVGEVKFTGQVTPDIKRLEYGVDFKRVMRSKLKLGIANGWMKADGEVIYRASDMRVGLFKDAEPA